MLLCTLGTIFKPYLWSTERILSVVEKVGNGKNVIMQETKNSNNTRGTQQKQDFRAVRQTGNAMESTIRRVSVF